MADEFQGYYERGMRDEVSNAEFEDRLAKSLLSETVQQISDNALPEEPGRAD